MYDISHMYLETTKDAQYLELVHDHGNAKFIDKLYTHVNEFMSSPGHQKDIESIDSLAA
jgi:hypothetical protein